MNGMGCTMLRGAHPGCCLAAPCSMDDMAVDSDDEFFAKNDLKFWGTTPSVPSALSQNVGPLDEDDDDDDCSLGGVVDKDVKPGEEAAAQPPMEEESTGRHELLPTHIPFDDEPTPNVVSVETTLRQNVTPGNSWTHLLMWPREMRCQVLDPSTANTLYQSLTEYTSAGLGVMERRLSGITRLSLRMVLQGMVLNSPEAEQTYLADTVGRIQITLARVLEEAGVSDVDRRVCLVLRDEEPVVPPGQEYWLHWPCIAVNQHDVTREWCDGLLRRSDLAPGWGVTALVPRNTASYYPMYGCRVGPGEPRMLVQYLVDGRGRVRPGTDVGPHPSRRPPPVGGLVARSAAPHVRAAVRGAQPDLPRLRQRTGRWSRRGGPRPPPAAPDLQHQPDGHTALPAGARLHGRHVLESVGARCLQRGILADRGSDPSGRGPGPGPPGAVAGPDRQRAAVQRGGRDGARGHRRRPLGLPVVAAVDARIAAAPAAPDGDGAGAPVVVVRPPLGGPGVRAADAERLPDAPGEPTGSCG